MYRFFYHYFKAKDKMSVHWRGACYAVDQVICRVPCETKRNKRQPRIVMQGFASDVRIQKGVATIR